MKSFGLSKAVAVRIHEQLQQQIEQTLSVSGLPVIRSTEATQRENTFGRRLANAVADCWREGFQKLIIVGGDSPELTTRDISLTQEALDAGRPTLGKNFRGGSFIIGLLQESFRQNQFAELPWQTDRIADALHKELGICCTNGKADIYELSARADCNSKQDLHTFAQRSACEVWARLLLTCVRRITPLDTERALVSCFGESPTLRGPPAELTIAA